MTRLAATAALAVIIGLSLVTRFAHADFHFFYIQEIFSDPTGSVQFIELFTLSAGQQNLHPGHTVTSSTQSFPFPMDAPTPTNNRHILLATEDFGLIPGGATPNYIIPDNFFNPAGDTINFGEGTSVHTFGPGNPLPFDGVNSLHYTSFFGSSTVAPNSPRNHANAGTSVTIPPPFTTGDYNGDTFVNAADYTIWRNSLGQEVDNDGDGADGDQDGGIDRGDYIYWKNQYSGAFGGAGAGQEAFSPVPEPSFAVMALIALSILPVRSIRKKRCAIH